MKQMTLMESKHAHHYILETPTGVAPVFDDGPWVRVTVEEIE